MNNCGIILSIYIATYNRQKTIFNLVSNLLSIHSKEFEIVVIDDRSSDETFEKLKSIHDVRLNVYQNIEREGIKENGAMTNWYKALQYCNGLFAMHLNDRDLCSKRGILELIDFLKNNADLSGGYCNSLSKEYVYLTSEEAFLNIPYRASHPTSIIFNMNYLKEITNLKQFYTKKLSYIHPHDLVLGHLTEYGGQFNYKKIWSFAESDSFKNNKSFLYGKGDISNSWFSPSQRLREFDLFLKDIRNLSYDNKMKIKKVKKISKSYLYYCTYNYAYFISDPGQTAHYGIKPVKLSFKDLNNLLVNFSNDSYEIIKRNNFKISKINYYINCLLYFYVVSIIKPIWFFLKRKRGDKCEK